MKKYLAFLGAGMFFVGCFSLYLMLESANMSGSKFPEMPEYEMNSIENKIKQIESDLQRNHKTINLIKDAVRDIADGDSSSLNKLKDVIKTVDIGFKNKGDVIHMGQGAGGKINHPIIKKEDIKIAQGMCTLADAPETKTDVQMLDAFKIIPFDNPDGGVWKQGYPIDYSVLQWQDKPLKVFVVPHSHTDPGWIKTFDKYYSDQTRHILNNMVDKLEADSTRKFMYAEISFFSLWWSQINENTRERVKKLISNGQFEIITGGWVMNDEATTHYFAMIDQLIEGHQWVENQIGVKPKSGWAIDPFGHTPTMAYLLKKMGLSNMLIQRVHYSVKKYLAQRKQLEFMWRQNWDQNGVNDMFCHMMPFYSYDVPHTCGPDPKICCQFDFKRLPGGKISCPWKIPPVPITPANVAQKAEVLLDQWRKKSMLYQNNVVLIPLGDDFRYDKPIEWDQQFDNYKTLFNYMNGKKVWNVQAQFGTLSDYFAAVHERAGSQMGERVPGYPTLGGDFYTYSDRDDHYWSGYYTSRPFYKSLDRTMESHLRSAEIIFSYALAHARHNKVSSFPEESMMKSLVQARRNLGLFQHHDGITGTAKDFVVVDYGTKLINSLMDMKRLMGEMSHFLLTGNKAQYTYEESSQYFDIDEMRGSHDSLPVKTVIDVTTESTPIAFYNSLAQTRTQIIKVYVTSPHIIVKDTGGVVIDTQVDLYWNSNEDSASDMYKVSFVVVVPAVGISKYTIQKVDPDSNPRNSFSETTLYTTGGVAFRPGTGILKRGPFTIIPKTHEDFNVETSYMSAGFQGNKGTLKSLSYADTKQTHMTNIQFVKYGTTSGKEKSGAYLFLPDGNARPIEYDNPFIRVIRGKLLTEVHTFIPNVEHIVRLHNSPGIDSSVLDIYNLVDIRQQRNVEVAMRIKTDIVNKEREFYTDLNAFQVQRRKTLDKLPIQANYYPMPAMAFIQDARTRFSILSAQSLGVASLNTGELEVMLDRRLGQDDGRGLTQGVLDNKRTPNRFSFLMEQRDPKSKAPNMIPAGYPSLLSHQAYLQLTHPIYGFPKHAGGPSGDLLNTFQPMEKEMPCELHMLNLRTMQNPETIPELQFKPKETSALLVHRLGFDCNYPAKGLKCSTNEGKFTIADIFRGLDLKDVTGTSLSLMFDENAISPSSQLQIAPMEINTYKLKIR
ncbi:unnamed protein product [Owenia fusiformis]|uniref:Alpha-mannosidase n=1 Tax=Owenia fusiformis TaxID=6347 RepID=A0A8S4PB21_OWEFU|nr:unnamed protein product [Owenia fusiformis]